MSLFCGEVKYQYCIGFTAGQLVKLPATSTLVAGQHYTVANISTVPLTVESSGPNAILVQAANTTAIYTVVNTGINTAAAWSSAFIPSPVNDWTAQIETAANKTYFVDANTAYAGTINNIYIECATSGTVTAALKIAGTAVTSISAVAVTSTPQTVTQTGANIFTAGQAITLVTSSNAACLDLVFSVNYTRTN